MGIKFKEYLQLINDFADENPELLENEISTYRHGFFHPIYTSQVIRPAFKIKNKSHDGIEFFSEDEPQKDFKPNAVCVGFV